MVKKLHVYATSRATAKPIKLFDQATSLATEMSYELLDCSELSLENVPYIIKLMMFKNKFDLIFVCSNLLQNKGEIKTQTAMCSIHPETANVYCPQWNVERLHW